MLIEAIDGCSTADEILEIINNDESMVNVKDKNNNYPLFIACQYTGYETVAIKLYLIYPEALNQQVWKGYRNLCHICCGYGNPDLIKTIAQQNQTLLSDIDEIGRTPLFYACSKNRTESLKTLLTYESCILDVNRRDDFGQTALHVCCHHKSYDTLEALLDIETLNVNIVDNEGRTALYYLLLGFVEFGDIKHKKYEVINKFITLFPNVTKYSCQSNGYNIFHDAVCNGWDCDNYLESLLLLQKDAHELLNQGDNNGATPIHHLCKNIFFPDKLSPYINNPSIMINKADNSGKTALHYAAFYNRYR
jgi:ankyrin repeat protein